MSMETNRWVILIGGGYGAFLFVGTAEEAEQRRADKCQWERAVGSKRPADADDIDQPSTCWNHQLFANKKNVWYQCECGNCDSNKRTTNSGEAKL